MNEFYTLVFIYKFVNIRMYIYIYMYFEIRLFVVSTLLKSISSRKERDKQLSISSQADSLRARRYPFPFRRFADER